MTLQTKRFVGSVIDDRPVRGTVHSSQQFDVHLPYLADSAKQTSQDRLEALLPTTVTMPIVQFAPFSSLIQPSFWHKLTDLKIDVLRLSDEALTISGSYSVGRSITDRETGSEIALACNLSVGAESFDKDFKYVQTTWGITLHSQQGMRLQAIARLDTCLWNL
jgi:hypothetical protein